MRMESDWHELSSYCDGCKEKLWIKELLANSKGELQFHLICMKCGEEFKIMITVQHILAHCFDMDFMTVAKIKS